MVDMRSDVLLIVLIVAGSAFVGLLVLGALVVAWSRKALSRQQRSVSIVDESMELSRESVELCQDTPRLRHAQFHGARLISSLRP